MIDLDIVTCEYPPDIGGVSDYTRALARELSKRGYRIRIWASGYSLGEIHETARISIFRVFGAFQPSDLRRVGESWKRDKCKRTIFLQWAPTGYGLRMLNVLFCLWLAWRVLNGDHLHVMFHETYFSYREPNWKLKAGAVVQRLMAFILLNVADKSFTSTEFARRQLQRFHLRRNNIECLPVPASVEPVLGAPSTPFTVLKRLESNREPFVPRIGHFGLFSPNILRLLVPTIEHLLTINSCIEVAFIGACGVPYLTNLPTHLRPRVIVTGACSSDEVSNAISQCHLMFQPFSEGVSTRRTTAMAALSHGQLLVSTSGPFTTDIWLQSRSVTLLKSKEPRSMAEELNKIVKSDPASLDVAAEAREFYRRNFSMARTVERYCAQVTPVVSSTPASSVVDQ